MGRKDCNTLVEHKFGWVNTFGKAGLDNSQHQLVKLKAERNLDMLVVAPQECPQEVDQETD